MGKLYLFTSKGKEGKKGRAGKGKKGEKGEGKRIEGTGEAVPKYFGLVPPLLESTTSRSRCLLPSTHAQTDGPVEYITPPPPTMGRQRTVVQATA